MQTQKFPFGTTTKFNVVFYIFNHVYPIIIGVDVTRFKEFYFYTGIKRPILDIDNGVPSTWINGQSTDSGVLEG